MERESSAITIRRFIRGQAWCEGGVGMWEQRQTGGQRHTMLQQSFLSSSSSSFHSLSLSFSLSFSLSVSLSPFLHSFYYSQIDYLSQTHSVYLESMSSLYQYKMYHLFINFYMFIIICMCVCVCVCILFMLHVFLSAINYYTYLKDVNSFSL